MKTLYSVLCSLSSMHTKIVGGNQTCQLNIDLEGKSVKAGQKYIICNGALNEDFLEFTNGTALVLAELPWIDTKDYEDPQEKIKELYKRYERSVPTRESQKRKYCFKALTSDELAMDDLVYGEDRVKAAYELELYILLGVISGVLKWENPNYWYWKDKETGLILYRKWF